MTFILDQLASGQAKQDLNIALAKNIVQKKNTAWINELISGLTHKAKSIRYDCIKTLYEVAALPLLLDQLLQVPVNQAPAYAEQALTVITAPYKGRFAKILLMRLNDTEQESKRKRLEKVLKKLK